MKKLFVFSVLLAFVLSILSVNLIKVSATEYPSIYIEPASTENPALTAGMNYTVSIATNYTGCDVWGFEFTLTYDSSVLHGGIKTTDMWIGNGTATEFNTAHNLVVEDSEKVYVDENLKTRVTSGFDAWAGDGGTTEFNATHTPVVNNTETVYLNFTDMWIGNGTTTEFNTTHNLVVEDSEKVYVDENLKTRVTCNAMDAWAGDGVKTEFNTTHTPVVQYSETVYVNNTEMTRDVNYTINYDLGTITFMETPWGGADIAATYDYGHYTINYDVATITFMEAPSDGADIKATYDAKMTRGVDYTTGYTSDMNMTITFIGAPGAWVNIRATYDYGHYTISYKADLSMTITFRWAPAAATEIRAVYLYDGVTNGDLITWGVGAIMWKPGSFNNTAGTISTTGNAFFSMPPTPPPTTCGPGTLANITFTVVGYGTSNLTLGPETRLIGIDEFEHEYDIINAVRDPDHIQHGYFSNVIPGDFDKDKDVDPSDFAVFAGAYGTSPPSNPACDFDGDNDVDPSDFAVFAGNYGRFV